VRYRDCFAHLASRQTDQFVVTSAGNSGQIWWDVTRDHERVFYLDASMSLSTMFASGIAMGHPERQVWAFMGDGAFCMNPGMLMVERQMNLPNLVHFLVSNRRYGATSNAALPNQAANDYAAIARGMGLARVFEFASLEALESGLDAALDGADGHTFVVLEVEPLSDAEQKLPQPPMDGPELKYLFGRHVERSTGVKIFDHAL